MTNTPDFSNYRSELPLEFGVESFGDITLDPQGQPVTHAQAIRNVVDEAVLADELGLDIFALGEHHRPDYSISAPDMVLAGMATRTKNIRLGSAVTILSSDDPVRVHERFATLDALANGRSEIMIGRGSFIESFPLFGYNLENYDELFEEKMELFMKLRNEQPLTWEGKFTQNLSDVSVYPSYEHHPLRTWVAVGATAKSAVRAAKYDTHLMMAIIGAPAERFVPLAELYRRTQAELGHDVATSGVGYHSWGYVAETDDIAHAEFKQAFMDQHRAIGKDRGWPAPTNGQYRAELTRGSLAVGSVESVAKNIAHGMKVLGANRYDMKISNGPLSHEKIMASMELYATKVVPLVKDMLSEN
ncbi:LLM class flavin-dependent oxidoreductase [Corynebacterium caspium]|uniref:LLM class flavin-dependent oxidoreductase n=1 Tax=Corynebacterium caspium TaxID=234828 RepID=UPI00036AF611|nr:LLM class flavin-dependent oxidoreductase [Corynebacterium caspium]WKD58445.1 Alkanal monooxygenase alpha chain [Corynebacterium caspium DSM 44850]